MVDIKRDVLFVGAGTGASAVFYYRCLLPASTMDASYMSVVGDWPNCRWCTGMIQDREGDGPPNSMIAAFENYEIIILQEPHTDGWLSLIKALRAAGKIVVYECDDYLHGIFEKKDHDFRKGFTRKHLDGYERCMRACDAMIVSTDFIAEKYARFNKRIFVCKNGLDTGRYNLTRPSRKTVNIGWAGATGHRDAVMPWLQTVANVMGDNPNTCFISIGQGFATGFVPAFGDERAMAIPWAAIEQYPGAMTMFDIAIAPAGKGGWYQGKSDLRFLEAGALGIPVIGNPLVYNEIKHGETGFHAESALSFGKYLNILVRDHEKREQMGAAAREYVREHRAFPKANEQWRQVFEELAS